MKTKLGLAVLLIAALGITGCATSSKTDAPAGSGQSGGQSGSSAGTGAAPSTGSATGESMAKDGSQMPFELTIHFAFDSSALDEQGRKVVEAHGRYLAANPKVKVRLEGHTDARGSREYNLALGERRAQTVEKLLRVLNIPANRISVTSYGEEKPAMPGNNEEAWTFNRRVELVY